jgi:Histone H1-like protein Hc1
MTTVPNPPTPPSLDAFEQLEKLVVAAKEDYQKAVGGNKAAGTRVRKSMQDIKHQAQEIRKKVLETRSTTP